MTSESDAPTRLPDPEMSAGGAAVLSLTTLVLITGYLFIGIGANLTVLKTTPILRSHPVPVGSLLFAISYTWIDLVNRHLGKRQARRLIAVSVVANVILILWFQAYIHLPGTDAWASVPTN